MVGCPRQAPNNGSLIFIELAPARQSTFAATRAAIF